METNRKLRTFRDEFIFSLWFNLCSRPISTQVVHNRTSLKLTNQGFEPPQTPVCNETGNFGN